MSYIVPRDKPQECSKYPYINLYNDCRLMWGSERIRTVDEQYRHCPLISIPTPHGELVDRGVLMDIYDDRLTAIAERYSPDSSECGILSGAMKLLAIMPTVIEAEGET